MNSTITYRELEQVLLGLGFKRLRAPGSHVYFEHAPSGAAVIVKDYNPSEAVPLYKLSAAEAALENFGILERSEFRRRLEQSASPAKAS
jgi:predicted RNA binding protein YcfA (HicA-like mRNA interferase family)